jgi:hypothetical protein
MIESQKGERDLAVLVVPRVGALEPTGSPWVPYRVVDLHGGVVEAVGAYLAELQAMGRAELTMRSYATSLLRWFRFLWAVQVPWEEATRVEARDFSRWVQIGGKPPAAGSRSAESATPAVVPAPNRLTGKAAPGRRYAPTTAAHSETVLRSFYDFHLDAGTGPMVNPFPLARERARRRAGAHHTPMDPPRNERVGRYRPKVPARAPRCIPDELFNELFAGLASHRDRALVAFWVSTGARASELLGGRLHREPTYRGDRLHGLGPLLLPGHRSVGQRRPGAVGAVGRSQSHPPRRAEPQEANHHP